MVLNSVSFSFFHMGLLGRIEDFMGFCSTEYGYFVKWKSGFRLRRLKVTLEDMQQYFDGLTEETLGEYDWIVHGGDIAKAGEDLFFYLDLCVRDGVYFVETTTNDPYASPDEDNKQGIYIPRWGKEKKVYTRRIPEPILNDLRKEHDFLVGIIHGFKKIRWAIDKELKGDRCEIPEAQYLKHDHDHYVRETYDDLEALATFHASGKDHPFIIDRPPNELSKNESTYQRNLFYDAVNRLVVH